MTAVRGFSSFTSSDRIDLSSRQFVDHKFETYARLRQEAPVQKVKLSLFRPYAFSRYEDCVKMLKDPRFVRNRNTATAGGGRFPMPMPRSVTLLTSGLISSDGEDHRRLRMLVHTAFTPRALSRLESRIESLTVQLLDDLIEAARFDLKRAYALPIPVTVISEMVGAEGAEVAEFKQHMRGVMQSFSGWRLLPLLVYYIPRLVALVRRMIERKRIEPGPDILSALIHAEEEGERLTEDELVAMVFTLIVAGYETTVHLITNGVLTLLQHPEQMALLRRDPERIESAIEEIIRFAGPVQTAEVHYAAEDVTIHGVTIPRGASAIPLLGSANRDPMAFSAPDRFDITRSPNRHLGFGQGIHYCLGAPLARIETRIALLNLLERAPRLRLAVEPHELTLDRVAGFHHYESLPVRVD